MRMNLVCLLVSFLYYFILLGKKNDDDSCLIDSVMQLLSFITVTTITNEYANNHRTISL